MHVTSTTTKGDRTSALQRCGSGTCATMRFACQSATIIRQTCVTHVTLPGSLARCALQKNVATYEC
eukprot:1542614-Prymnesium_polylepis.1